MTTTRRFSFVLCLGFILILLVPGASAETRKAQVDGLVVVGNQLYSGGEVTVYEVGTGELLAIDIDGQRVGLAYRSQIERRLGEDRPRVIFIKDSRGHYRLASATTELITPIQTVASVPGHTTVPDAAPVRPFDGQAVASR